MKRSNKRVRNIAPEIGVFLLPVHYFFHRFYVYYIRFITRQIHIIIVMGWHASIMRALSLRVTKLSRKAIWLLIIVFFSSEGDQPRLRLSFNQMWSNVVQKILCRLFMELFKRDW